MTVSNIHIFFPPVFVGTIVALVAGMVIVMLLVLFVKRKVGSEKGTRSVNPIPYPTIDVTLAKERSCVRVTRGDLGMRTTTIPLEHWLALMRTLDIPVQSDWLVTPMKMLAHCTHERCKRALEDKQKVRSLTFHAREYADQLMDLTASASTSEVVVCELVNRRPATHLADEEAYKHFVNGLLAHSLTRQT